MSDRAIARRYASALYQEARSAGAVDQTDSDVALLQQAISDSRDLKLLLASPVVSTPKKETIFRRLFEPHVSRLVLTFLFFVTKKGRDALVPLILDEYHAYRLEEQGIAMAAARVAVPMTDEETEELRSSIGGMIDKEIRLSVDVDRSLIGGVVVKVGDRVFDGSLKSQLALLRRQMEGLTNHRN